jgi:pSer/pThr/pTyr-binding forkhead associated (FHA) protein
MKVEPHGELVPVGGGDSIPLQREHLTVGRRNSCDIYLPFHTVSGLHCELAFRDGYWFIRDLGSTNGVKVNGQRLQQKVLRPGDEVSIAKRKFTIHYTIPVGHSALEEMEEDISQSLLEKAGLERPKPPRDALLRRRQLDADNFLADEDE